MGSFATGPFTAPNLKVVFVDVLTVQNCWAPVKIAQNSAELRRTAQNWRLVSAVPRVEYFSFEFVGMNGGSFF